MTAASTARWQCPPAVILAAVDFGEASAAALRIASAVATAFDARLRAMHAERFEPPAYFTLEQVGRLEAEQRRTQAAGVEHLNRFAVEAAAHPVEGLVLDEPPVEAILDAAASADLIVVGTHGRRGPGRWWLGSVAERVVRGAEVPVLVTRTAPTPARDVFKRIVLVHEGKDAVRMARTCADRLAMIAGGTVIDGGPIGQCDAGVVDRASLVVMARGARQSWSLTDQVTRVLGACQKPVLFLPYEKENAP